MTASPFGSHAAASAGLTASPFGSHEASSAASFLSLVTRPAPSATSSPFGSPVEATEEGPTASAEPYLSLFGTGAASARPARSAWRSNKLPRQKYVDTKEEEAGETPPLDS